MISTLISRLFFHEDMKYCVRMSCVVNGSEKGSHSSLLLLDWILHWALATEINPVFFFLLRVQSQINRKENSICIASKLLRQHTAVHKLAFT